MGEMESQGISRVGHTVSARLLESQMCTGLLVLWIFGRRVQKRGNGLYGLSA